MLKEIKNTLKSGRQSHEISSAFLIQQHPEIKGQLGTLEMVREFSYRKPAIWTGLFLVFAGVVVLVDIITHFLFRGLVWSIPFLILCLIQIYLGIRLAILVRREYVFVTSRRVVYQKMNLWGKPAANARSVLISDIACAHLFKRAVMFQAQSGGGDLLLKLKSNKKWLLPALYHGEYVTEAIASELKVNPLA